MAPWGLDFPTADGAAGVGTVDTTRTAHRQLHNAGTARISRYVTVPASVDQRARPVAADRSDDHADLLQL